MPWNLVLGKIEERNPGGRRDEGRVEKRWLREVFEDIEEMGIRTWRKREMDRKECEEIIRQALVI